MRILVLLCIVMATGLTFGQQMPQYSQYVRNQYMVNPAAAGVYDYADITLGGRMQWTGFENAPKTSYLYFSSSLDNLRGGHMKRTYGKVASNNKSVRHPTMRLGKFSHAFGAQVVADQYGAYRTFRMMGTYAMHIPLSRDYSMSFGANLGLSNRAFLADKAQVLNVMTGTGVDNVYNTYTSNQKGQYNMDIDLGIYFYGKQLFAGLSTTELTGDLVRFGNKTVNFDPKIHFFLTGGYHFIVNQNVKITPAILAKYVINAPLSIEGTVQAEFRNRFWFGLSYRHKAAVVGMVGMVVSDWFKFGYSYDLSISRLINYNNGGHEVVLSFMLGGGGRGSGASFN